MLEHMMVARLLMTKSFGMLKLSSRQEYLVMNSSIISIPWAVLMFEYMDTASHVTSLAVDGSFFRSLSCWIMNKNF